VADGANAGPLPSLEPGSSSLSVQDELSASLLIDPLLRRYARMVVAFGFSAFLVGVTVRASQRRLGRTSHAQLRRRWGRLLRIQIAQCRLQWRL
jgi:hypothetical protein